MDDHANLPRKPTNDAYFRSRLTNPKKNDNVPFLLVVSTHHLRYEVISTPTSIYMVIEYAGGELFNYIVDNTRVNFSGFRSMRQMLRTHLERATPTKNLMLIVFNFTLFFPHSLE